MVGLAEAFDPLQFRHIVRGFSHAAKFLFNFTLLRLLMLLRFHRGIKHDLLILGKSVEFIAQDTN